MPRVLWCHQKGFQILQSGSEKSLESFEFNAVSRRYFHKFSLWCPSSSVSVYPLDLPFLHPICRQFTACDHLIWLKTGDELPTNQYQRDYGARVVARPAFGQRKEGIHKATSFRVKADFLSAGPPLAGYTARLSRVGQFWLVEPSQSSEGGEGGAGIGRLSLRWWGRSTWMGS